MNKSKNKQMQNSKVFRIIISIEIVACMFAMMAAVGSVAKSYRTGKAEVGIRELIWNMDRGDYYEAYKDSLHNNIKGLTGTEDGLAIYSAGKYFQERFLYEAIKDQDKERARDMENSMKELSDKATELGYGYTIDAMNEAIDKYNEK